MSENSGKRATNLMYSPSTARAVQDPLEADGETNGWLTPLKDSEGRSLLSQAVVYGQLEKTKALVEQGCPLNLRDSSGRTALLVAAYQGWYEGLAYLVDHGANSSIPDTRGRLPLHASTYCNDVRCLSLLLQCSPNLVNAPDVELMTPLHWAAFHDQAQNVEKLISYGANLSAKDIEGKTPLHWACQNGSLSCVEVLLNQPQSHNLVNLRDRSGKGPIHYAAAAGHAAIVARLAMAPKADVHLDDPADRQPLHWAAALGRTDTTRKLLQFGANPKVVDTSGRTALYYAKKAEHKGCVQIICAHIEMNKKKNKKQQDTEERQYVPNMSYDAQLKGQHQSTSQDVICGTPRAQTPSQKVLATPNRQPLGTPVHTVHVTALIGVPPTAEKHNGSPVLVVSQNPAINCDQNPSSDKDQQATNLSVSTKMNFSNNNALGPPQQLPELRGSDSNKTEAREAAEVGISNVHTQQVHSRTLPPLRIGPKLVSGGKPHTHQQRSNEAMDVKELGSDCSSEQPFETAEKTAAESAKSQHVDRLPKDMRFRPTTALYSQPITSDSED